MSIISNINASISTRGTIIWIALMSTAPVTFITVGILDQFGAFGAAINSYISPCLLAAGAIALIILVPFSVSLKHVSICGDQIVADSLFGPKRSFSTSDLHYVDLSFSSPAIATIHLLDGSKIKYIPLTAGIFMDVAEPTKQIIDLARANRESLGR